MLQASEIAPRPSTKKRQAEEDEEEEDDINEIKPTQADLDDDRSPSAVTIHVHRCVLPLTLFLQPIRRIRKRVRVENVENGDADEATPENQQPLFQEPDADGDAE